MTAAGDEPAEGASRDAGGGAAPLRISVAWLCDGAVCVRALEVPAGTRLGALIGSVLTGFIPSATLIDSAIAIHGRLRGPDQLLAEGDRIELLGPLLVDPKVARERRVAHRRAQQAGEGRRGAAPRSRVSAPGTPPRSTAPGPDADG